MDEKPAIPDPESDETVDSDQTLAASSQAGASPLTPGDEQRYRILRPHAQGGLGAVFVALDRELNREVALKQILDAHADNPISRERFVLEAEVTGSLEHPGIVPIYGLGANDQGRPFYAMRFIRGDNLMEAIARFHHQDSKHDAGARALGLQKLLRRFLDVCNAIDYAHGRGVLHRDIKPGNVIVGKYGETLVVDWGLAKVRGRSTDTAPSEQEENVLIPSSLSSTTETVAGTTVGTPAYMSPEQARGDLEALGPASDVYSLGATLYCLLTGKPPFEGNVKAVLDAVVHGRLVRPRRLDASIDRALEGVCLHAMALSPGDRYPTVRALADDIERWLADEPVTAVRDPWWTRLRRWSRRHRAVASSVGVGAATVFTALSVSTVLISRERSKAEANFQKARAAVDTYFTTVSESKLLDVPGLQPLRKDLLDSALEYYREFLREHGDDTSVRKESAAASFRVGWITQMVGSEDDAKESYLTAITLYEQLVRDEPGVTEHRRNLARCYGAMGFASEGADALAYHRKALVIRQALARTATADVTASNDVARTYGNIASVLRNLGKPEDALAALDSAAAIGEELVTLPLDTVGTTDEFTRRSDPWANVREDLAQAHLRRTNILRETSMFDDADLAWQRSHDLFQVLVAKRPTYENKHLLASCELAGGNLRSAQGRFVEANQILERAQQIFQELVASNPRVMSYRDNLAETQLARGGVLNRLGRSTDALELTQQSVAILEQALTEERTPGRQTLYVRSLRQTGNLLMRAGRTSEALAVFRRARDIQEEVVRSEPESIYHSSTLASLLSSLGQAAAASGNREEARHAFLRANELIATWASKYPAQRYNQACNIALIIPLSPPAQRDSLAAHAVGVLRQAIEAGYEDRVGMSKDSDLDALRGRADFRELMAESQTK